MTGVKAPSRDSRQPSRRALRVRLGIMLIVSDVMMLLVSFGLAGLIYPTETMTRQWVLISAILIPVYVGCAANMRAFAGDVLRAHSRSTVRAWRAFAMAVGIVILVAFGLKTSETFSRGMLALSVMLSPLALAAGRYFITDHANRLLGGDPYSTLLICDGDYAVPADRNYTVLRARREGFDPDRHDPDMYDALARAVRNVDRVVVMCAPERRLSWAHALKGADVQSEIRVPELEMLAPLGMARQDGQLTVIVASGPLKLMDRIWKRTFDIVSAGTATLLLLPLFAVVAVLIKLDSPGPVFFVQTRIGQGNRLFRVLKFRSMRTDACDDRAATLTQRSDPRVTRIGDFLRRSSIDELPQLLNVLKGDMSIVGPRPHALGARAADKLYWEVDSRYWHRHAAKPGLTGLAQVRGYRGTTHEEADLVNRLQADLEYLNHWSLLKDFWIILRTLGVLLHRNAY